MATGNFVLFKLPKAAVAWLQSQAPLSDIEADAVLPGLNKTKRVKPSVICLATQAEASDHASGNQIAELVIQIISDSDDDANGDTHEARTNAVAAVMSTDTIAADLSSSLADFTAFLCQPAGQSFGINDDTDWVSTLTYRVHCCGSDIS